MIAAVFRPAVLSLFALSACGSMVVPPNGDGSTSDASSLPDASTVSDGAAPTGCEASRPLFGEAFRPLEYMNVARVPGGYVVAASASDRTVYVRAFDAEFNAVGDELALRSERATTFDVPHLFLSFEGTNGALSFDASLHELSVDSALRVTVVRSVVAEQGSARHALLGAWPARLGTRRISAIARDGSVWSLFDTGFIRAAEAQLATPFNAPVSFQLASDGSGGYVSIQTIPRRDVNDSVQIRRLITGHGALIETSSRLETGASVSPAILVGNELVRLHRRVDTTGGFRQLFSLVRHEASSGDSAGLANLNETGIVTSGAIGVTSATAPLSSALLVWMRMTSGPTDQRIVSQWGPSGTPVFLDTVGERSMIQGAQVDADGMRGWILWGTYQGSPGMSESRFFVRCVRR